MMEAMLRVLGWSHPLFAQPDAALGWSFRPGVSGWSSHEGTAHVRINRHGFRGTDWPRAPAPGTLRIALLGDSQVDSTNLPHEQALNGVVERRLAACPALAGRRPDVLNFGVSGYGTAQQYVLLEQRVAAFKPDVVVLGFYVGNDVMNNSRALSASDQRLKPYFTVSSSGVLAADNGFATSNGFARETGRDWIKRLVNSSYLLQALKQAYRRRPIVPAQPDFATDVGGEPRKLYQPEGAGLYAPPADETWRAAWAVTEQLLLRMRDWTQQRGLPFMLVLIPDPVQALPGADWRRDIAQALNGAALDYPSSRIARFAAQNGIRHLDLLGPFQAYGDANRKFLYGFPPSLGDGHLNATGTQVGGGLIADWLCKEIAPGAS
jgi:lysophospholipase L1-like esterase